MNVSKDFEELFVSFNARKVKALIVGGFAFSFHAKPRYTKDIDILIEPTSENASRVLLALADFGFGSLNLKIEDFITPGYIIQLGFPPNRIDLLTSIVGVRFEDAWERRVEGHFGEQTVYYIGLEDLIINKQAAGRPEDLVDVKNLKALTRPGKGRQ